MKLAGCIIKDDDGKILLIHRNTPKRMQWEIPGGKVDSGETPEQTAVRELKEELDVVVEVVRQIGSKIFPEDGEEHEYHWFEAIVKEGNLRLVESHAFDDFKHFTIEEMQQIQGELSANTKNLVNSFVSREIKL